MNKVKTKIPYIALLILDLILPSADRNYLIGDYEEIYLSKSTASGTRTAYVWLWGQIIRAIYIYGVDKIIESIGMFRNYFKTAYRNIVKSKLYSIINIAGLAIGIATCLVILTFIKYEFSFDSFHKSSANIYRIETEGVIGGKALNIPLVPAPMAKTLVEEVPEVVLATNLQPMGQQLLKNKEIKEYVENFVFAEENFFNVFSYNLTAGDPSEVLKAPYTAVITKETAIRFFGSENPIGKTITRGRAQNFTITGVVDLTGQNTHLEFDILASMETYYQTDPQVRDVWLGWSFPTYVVLAEGITAETMNEKLAAINDKYIGKILAQIGATINNYARPIDEIYLHSNMEHDFGPRSDIGYVYAFAAIAFFILLIACINFMNLSTARASKRAKEVGVRKVMGAFRGQLARQFLGESMIFTFMSVLLSLVIAYSALPWFSQLSQRNLVLDGSELPMIIATLFGIGIFVGLVSGSYPALLLSSFNPASVLKGGGSQGMRSSNFRSVMVVLQFTVSIALIIGSFIVYGQIDYLLNKDLGFNKEELLAIRIRNIDSDRIETLKSELKLINGVVNASATQDYPGNSNSFLNPYFPEGKKDEQPLMMTEISIDTDYLDTFGIKLVKGRNLSKEILSDSPNAIMINEAAVKKLGWDDPIGKNITKPTGTDITDRFSQIIVGVFEDFHYSDILSPIDPLFVNLNDNNYSYVVLKMNSSDLAASIEKVKGAWAKFDAEYPMEYRFVNEVFDNKFNDVIKLGSIFNVFTMIAIFIGCLGLFGLASFTSEQRTKEIGVRKVLGSSIRSIVMLLCKDFLKLVLIANIIAWPVAYYFMESWLYNFPYHNELGLSSFVFSSILAISVALFTVVYQSIKVAVSNPVNSLRYE